MLVAGQVHAEFSQALVAECICRRDGGGRPTKRRWPRERPSPPDSERDRGGLPGDYFMPEARGYDSVEVEVTWDAHPAGRVHGHARFRFVSCVNELPAAISQRIYPPNIAPSES